MRTTILCLLTTLWVAIVSLPAAGAQNQITFWTTEVEKERLEIQRGIARAFTGKTGIDVRVVPVQENLLTQRVTAAYAARSLPDVLFHPVDFTIGWTEAGILMVTIPILVLFLFFERRLVRRLTAGAMKG